VGKRDVTEKKARAVFLDRDGVLNEPVFRDRRPYPPARAEDLRVYDGVVTGCARLKAAGFLLVVISNQPDVGRGLTQKETVDQINRKLRAIIPALEHFETCFHAGESHGESCLCRKPKPGMILRAAKMMGIDVAQSFVIGDRWRDIDCARAAGSRAIFIDRGYAEQLVEKPDVTVTTFDAAVRAVLELAGSDSLPEPPRRP
jgi:D-glycero-D-manno-heptose 1,7-bisphosphate phosphatase